MHTLVRWNPIRNTYNLLDDFDRLFAPSRLQTNTTSAMAMDVMENETAYIVKASVPGLTADDLEITLEDNKLSITGEIKADESFEKEQYHIRERHYGRGTFGGS